jgi:hypothetical protein
MNVESMDTPQKFGCVVLYDIKKRNYKYISSTKDYKKLLKQFDAALELVAGDMYEKSSVPYFYNQQSKPYFDVDEEKHVNEPHNEIEFCKDLVPKIEEMFPSEKALDILFMKRPTRVLQDDKVKYSYHIVVNNIRITYTNLKKLIIQHNFEEIFDMKVYNRNIGLHSIYTKTKIDKKTGGIIDVGQIVPFNHLTGEELININLFDYCPSYIEEGFEDYDLHVEIVSTVPLLIPKKRIDTQTTTISDKVLTYKEVSKEDDDNCDDGDTVTPLEKKLEEYLNHLSEKRADGRDEWLNMIFCIINICKKNNISRRKCENLLHLFSKKCQNRYNEDDVDKWIDINYDKTRPQGYGWNYLVHTCLQQDDPDYYERKVGKTYYIVKKNFEKHVSKCRNPVGFLRIVRDELIMSDNPDPYQFLTKDKLQVNYEEDTYWVEEKNKKGEIELVEKAFLPTWFKDKTKPIYERIVFKPYHLDAALAKKYYNIYEGTRAELLPVCKNYEAIQSVLDHIKNVMVNGNEAHYDWLMQYLAQMIQNPSKKTGVCVVFHGRQGCGKNMIIDAFANGILGRKLSISTSNPDKTFFGHFNGVCLNKILGVCNEVGSEVYNCMDKLKDLVTAPDMINEKKGVDSIIVENYINLIMTTNNTNPLNISVDDRRIVWFDCSNTYVGNEEYFDKLLTILENDENISAFYHYLKEKVNITITNFQKKRPITRGYKRLQVLNLPSYIRWCKDYVDEKPFRKYKEAIVLVEKKTAIYTDYKIWCEKNKYSALKRDTFFHHLEEDDTGIKKCIHDGNECFRFTKVQVDTWLEKNLLKEKEDIEKISEDYNNSNFAEDSDSD